MRFLKIIVMLLVVAAFTAATLGLFRIPIFTDTTSESAAETSSANQPPAPTATSSSETPQHSEQVLVANPYTGEHIPAAQLADCQSGVRVVDLEGNLSGAAKTNTHVYDGYCHILPRANPATFVALDFYYGKDTNGVWILANPSEEGSLRSIEIIGVDPATFTLIHDPTRDNFKFSNEKFSNIYTKDKNHVYAYGQIVDAADPATFVLVDPPQMTSCPSRAASCQFDAQDSHLRFYRGHGVPQADSQALP